MQQQETNVPGVVGFCLMILGYLTCGVLCVPALFVSGFGMYREPKGLAIAGFLLSIPPVLGLIVVVVLFAVGSSLPTISRMRTQNIPSVESQLEKIQSERQR